MVGLVLKLYLERSEILAQLRISDPLKDDLNNVIIVHAHTTFL